MWIASSRSSLRLALPWLLLPLHALPKAVARVSPVGRSDVQIPIRSHRNRSSGSTRPSSRSSTTSCTAHYSVNGPQSSAGPVQSIKLHASAKEHTAKKAEPLGAVVAHRILASRPFRLRLVARLAAAAAGSRFAFLPDLGFHSCTQTFVDEAPPMVCASSVAC
ncbi:uncharacterized protein PSFLO_02637 [Pseudozyma flocculosa]|uniref:Secreted protein n=1 Tax=Pseudozyma flocculosa TaxID=84751 RepID=A0A5C3EZE6_9BASI|nr:uncharacterized protein PSFLO_02637 [Pseudozyma flocculosa]